MRTVVGVTVSARFAGDEVRLERDLDLDGATIVAGMLVDLTDSETTTVASVTLGLDTGAEPTLIVELHPVTVAAAEFSDLVGELVVGEWYRP